MKELKDHYKVTTDDGTESLFSTLYNESCHSQLGASIETKLHYIEGCLLPIKFESQERVKIIEVGMGTGLGYIETLKAHQEQKSKSKIHFLTVEISAELLDFVKELKLDFDNYPLFKDLVLVNPEMGLYQTKKNGHTLEVLIGDARETLPLYKEQFDFQGDAIFQDAFSPKRNSTLWTYEWFKLLNELSNKYVALATYSSSSSMRKAMIKAGWRITKGNSFGPKRSSTRASLIGETDPDISTQLGTSPAITLMDDNAGEYKL